MFLFPFVSLHDVLNAGFVGDQKCPHVVWHCDDTGTANYVYDMLVNWC
jgi:hypothetical protein